MIGYAKVTRDFTDRKRAEEAVMLQLSGALLANMDVRKLLEAISASFARWFRTMRRRWASTIATVKHADGAVPGIRQKANCEVGTCDFRWRGRRRERAFRSGEPVIVTRLQDSHFAEDGMRHLTSNWECGRAAGFR